MENHLGEQLGTNSDAKLARETEVWSQDGHVDAIWRTKRHQVRTQRRSWGAQVGAKGAQKGHAHHWRARGSINLNATRAPPRPLMEEV